MDYHCPTIQLVEEITFESGKDKIDKCKTSCIMVIPWLVTWNSHFKGGLHDSANTSDNVCV